MPNIETTVAYQGYITVTANPQPLSAEWGEDRAARVVEIYNPDYDFSTGEGNGVDIVTGNQGAQQRQVSPGGNRIIECRKLSDIWVRTRLKADAAGYAPVRIMFDVSWERLADEDND